MGIYETEQEDEYLEKARQIHRGNPVVDTHLDLAAEIYWRQLNGEKEIIKTHFLPYMRAGGLKVVVSSIFIETKFLPESGMEQAMNQISALLSDLETVEGEVLLIKSRKDLERVLHSDLIGILLYMEGMDEIGQDHHCLRAFYELGVRGASLTWSRPNALGMGCCKAREHEDHKGGLTAFGKETVKRLQDMNMFVDVSHLNDDGFYDVAKLMKKPFLATHSNCRAVYDSYRNLTDDQILLLKKAGGVMGLNGCDCIVGLELVDREGNLQNPIPKLCDHIEHTIALAGADSVGFGFDICDTYELAYEEYCGRDISHFKRGDCISNHSEMPLITAELLRRGHSEEEIRKILGGNMLRVFSEVLV